MIGSFSATADFPGHINDDLLQKKMKKITWLITSHLRNQFKDYSKYIVFTTV